MHEPEFEKEARGLPRPAGRSRTPQLLGWVFAVVVGSYLLGFPGYSRTPYTCAVCRMERVDKSGLGLRWSDEKETGLSLWYRDNVEQTHPHFWVEGTHCRRFGIPGLYEGYGCRIGAPITGLSMTVQMKVYQHFGDPLEAKQLFIRLGQFDNASSRTWRALIEWVEADFPGTWCDWWDKHRASGTVAAGSAAYSG
jgi:hypothetical protein